MAKNNADTQVIVCKIFIFTLKKFSERESLILLIFFVVVIIKS